MYSPETGRFQTRDTWDGDPNQPMSFNRWMYTNANPIGFVDPTGKVGCEDSNDAICRLRADELKEFGSSYVRTSVQQGSLLPVDGFALFADRAMELFGKDIRGALWAMTITINGMDANKGPVFKQAMKYGPQGSDFYLGANWLPYQNNPDYDQPNWDGSNPWIHSRRGDWRTEYWDKTANQAYHFWFYVAVAYFDSPGWSLSANIYHEILQDPPQCNTIDCWRWHDIGSLKDNEAPPVEGKTQQDWNLGLAGLQLGGILRSNSMFSEINNTNGFCDYELSALAYAPSVSPGNWIRANLKDPLVRSTVGGR